MRYDLGFATVLAIALLGSALALAAEATEGRSKSMTTAESADRGATMDTNVKYGAFRDILKKMGAGEKVDPKLWSTFVDAQNDGLKTGPKIGEKVPEFTLPDQNGREHSLQDLMGPSGLLLVFVRSADW